MTLGCTDCNGKGAGGRGVTTLDEAMDKETAEKTCRFPWSRFSGC